MVQKVARVFGVVLIAVGILGFVPQALTDGKLFGLFPVNPVHNGVHLGFGLWGLLASGSLAGSIRYLRAQAVIYAVLAVMGMVPATSDLFGFAPLHGNDVWLHAVLALGAAWAGWGMAQNRSA